MVTTGGTSLKDDIMRLYQPVHLLVGTPGRILDLAKKGVCVLKDCSMLVMDEVNMLHMEFVHLLNPIENMNNVENIHIIKHVLGNGGQKHNWI
jgi:superfamily II DNA/RNA helicase